MAAGLSSGQVGKYTAVHFFFCQNWLSPNGITLNAMTVEGGRECDGPKGIHRPNMLVTLIQV